MEKLNKKISVFILTKNSELQLRAALESVKWADEIIINDGFSTDNTLNICKEYNCTIYQRKFEGFDKERNFSIDKCNGPWIFEIDSDEVLDKDLQESILATIKEEKYPIYWIKRKDYWLNRYLMTIKLVRLYRKGMVKYKGCTHEEPIFQGKTGVLKGYCIHNSLGDSQEIYGWVGQLEREINKEIIKRFPPKGNESTSKKSLIFKMFYEPLKWFFGILFYKGLIFNGISAIMWSICGTYYKFLIYAKKYEEMYIRKK